MLGPTLVPSFDVTVYLVLDDFGKLGRSYRETDKEDCDLETVIANMLKGEYKRPVRVVAFNTAEGWARDVSEETAREVLARSLRDDLDLPPGTESFVGFHVPELSRRNVM